MITSLSLNVNDPKVDQGVALEIRTAATADMWLFWPNDENEVTAELDGKLPGLTKHKSGRLEQRSMTLGPISSGNETAVMTPDLAFAEAKRLLGETMFWDPLTTVALLLEKGDTKLVVEFSAGRLGQIEVICSQFADNRELAEVCVQTLIIPADDADDNVSGLAEFHEVNFDPDSHKIVVKLAAEPDDSASAVMAAEMVAMRLDSLKDESFKSFKPVNRK